MNLEQGCGALNLVNVTEPLKVARLILGVDDYSSNQVKIIPRVPPSWTGYEATNWPILTSKGIVRADIRYEKQTAKILFSLKVKQGQQIPDLAIRFVTAKGREWKSHHDVTKLELVKSN
jgi:hypothetical protein